MVVFDTTIALLFLRPGTNPPLDPASGVPVQQAGARIALLVESLEQARTGIIIPTPVLSELLVHVGEDAAAEEIRDVPDRALCTLAAIELAVMTRNAIEAGDKRGGVEAPWSKVKFDRQIVAIAKVMGATVIYSDDRQLRVFAEQQNLPVIRLADLPLPREPELPLPPPGVRPPEEQN